MLDIDVTSGTFAVSFPMGAADVITRGSALDMHGEFVAPVDDLSIAGDFGDGPAIQDVSPDDRLAVIGSLSNVAILDLTSHVVRVVPDVQGVGTFTPDGSTIVVFSNGSQPPDSCDAGVCNPRPFPDDGGDLSGRLPATAAFIDRFAYEFRCAT